MKKYGLFAKKGNRWIKVGKKEDYFGVRKNAENKVKELGGTLFGKKLKVKRF